MRRTRAATWHGGAAPPSCADGKSSRGACMFDAPTAEQLGYSTSTMRMANGASDSQQQVLQAAEPAAIASMDQPAVQLQQQDATCADAAALWPLTPSAVVDMAALSPYTPPAVALPSHTASHAPSALDAFLALVTGIESQPESILPGRVSIDDDISVVDSPQQHVAVSSATQGPHSQQCATSLQSLDMSDMVLSSHATSMLETAGLVSAASHDQPADTVGQDTAAHADLPDSDDDEVDSAELAVVDCDPAIKSNTVQLLSTMDVTVEVQQGVDVKAGVLHIDQQQQQVTDAPTTAADARYHKKGFLRTLRSLVATKGCMHASSIATQPQLVNNTPVKEQQPKAVEGMPILADSKTKKGALHKVKKEFKKACQGAQEALLQVGKFCVQARSELTGIFMCRGAAPIM